LPPDALTRAASALEVFMLAWCASFCASLSHFGCLVRRRQASERVARMRHRVSDALRHSRRKEFQTDPLAGSPIDRFGDNSPWRSIAVLAPDRPEHEVREFGHGGEATIVRDT
jgi:hypothetical protein